MLENQSLPSLLEKNLLQGTVMQVAAPQGRDRISPLTVMGGKTGANTRHLPTMVSSPARSFISHLTSCSLSQLYPVAARTPLHRWGYSILERTRDLLKGHTITRWQSQSPSPALQTLGQSTGVCVLPWLGSTWPQTLYASFASLWCTHLSAYTCKSWALDRSPNLPKWSTTIERKRKELPFSNKINPFQAPLTFHNILTFQMIMLQIPRCQEWLWGWYKLQKAREGPIWAESHSPSTPLLDMAYSTKLIFSLLKE